MKISKKENEDKREEWCIVYFFIRDRKSSGSIARDGIFSLKIFIAFIPAISCVTAFYAFFASLSERVRTYLVCICW